MTVTVDCAVKHNDPLSYSRQRKTDEIGEKKGNEEWPGTDNQ